MIENDELLIKLLIAVFSGVIGSVATSLFTRQRAKTQNVFELCREFNSEEFIKSRTAAIRMLCSSGRLNISAMQDNENFIHLSRVIHFFANLHISKKTKLIDGYVAFSFFGRYFRYFDKHFDTLFFFKEAEDEMEWKHLKRELMDLREWMAKYEFENKS